MSNEPSASNVEACMLRQQDPMNWSDEMWAAYEQDMQELHEVVKREQEKHSVEGQDRQ
jgi:hypothetical protein